MNTLQTSFLQLENGTTDINFPSVEFLVLDSAAAWCRYVLLCLDYFIIIEHFSIFLASYCSNSFF